MMTRSDYLESLATSGIPEHMHDGIVGYLTHGRLPGSFLLAVFSNDLRESVDRADDANAKALPAYVRWLFNYAPAMSWGSEDRVQLWIQQRKRVSA